MLIMDIHFFDQPGHMPQPKNKVRIEDLLVTPYPDRFRVHIEVKVTPFQERPNLLLVAEDAAGKNVSELNVIATMHAHMEFTMHLRGMNDPAGEYTLSAELFYETRQPPQDKWTKTFTIPPAENE